MTDLPRPTLPQTVLPSESLVGTNATSPLPLIPSLPNGFTIEDEEEFTIKCICDYQDDDGNTVFCETCETWQHIVCYYKLDNVPGQDDNHSCVDCEPRSLDTRLANEQQRAKRGKNPEDVEKKMKKTPAKSHKKRHKPPDHQNPPPGWGDVASPRNGANGNPREQPPTKRHKSSHKPSNSIQIPSATGKMSTQSRRSASASHPLQSPSKLPTNQSLDLNGEPYTPEFMHLYDDDPGETPTQPNVFNNIAISSHLASWTHDVEELERATNGKTHQEIFLRCEQSVDSMPAAQVKKEFKEDTEKEFHGRRPNWYYLTTESKLVKESFVGELRGKIGHMKDYVRDEANRWEYLRHPLPFVFFHPTLPIYIDTRKEGTIFRYIRRSCRPNIVLKTILENGADYRFCLMATRDIEPDEELTLTWTTDEHVRAITQIFGSAVKSEAYAESEEGYVLSWFSKVFANFGGCACRPPEDCNINKIAHKLRGASDPPVNGKAKKGRKTGSSTGRVTSRSGSEAVRYQDEDDQDDALSTSTSSRSKPQSRDMTPSNPSSIENKVIASGLEVSERDKRKIAALEKMEQDKNQPAQKKKKRNSGNAAPSNLTSATMKQSSTNTASKVRYTDASTNRKQSQSPTARTTFPAPIKTSSMAHSPTIPSPLSRPIYVDASMQTEPDPDDWFLSNQPSGIATPKRKFITLKKKLLIHAHQERAMLEEQLKSMQIVPAMEPNTNVNTVMADGNASPTTTLPSMKESDCDLKMENGTLSPVSPQAMISPTTDKVQSPRSPVKMRMESLQPTVLPLQPPPLPQATNSTWPVATQPLTNGFRNNNLRLPLPPVSLTNGAPPTPTTVAQSPVAQSPSTLLTPSINSSITQPSPIKKKLSLGDYMSRKASTSKPQTIAAQVSTRDKEDDKDKDAENGSSPTTSSLSVDPAKSLTTVAEEAPNDNGSGSPPSLKIEGNIESSMPTVTASTLKPTELDINTT